MRRWTTEENRHIYIAESADVVGDVTLEEGVSVWYQAVIRADHAPVRIGKESNMQDGCVIHTDVGFPVNIGARVTIGHGTILHGCEVSDETLIGMGAIVLNGAKIGKQCIIGAGAMVTQNMEIPDGSLAFGSPAKIIRPLREEEIQANIESAKDYLHLSEEHFKNNR